MQRSRGSEFVTIQWLCSQLCYETAANQWTIVQIEILATVSGSCACQPFGCRCSQNVTHCRKEMCWTCLFRQSMPFVKSKPPLPPRSLRLLRGTVCSTISSLCLHHAHPFVAAAEKTCHAQRSRGSEFVTIQWLCCHLCYETPANQWTIVEIEHLGSVGLKHGGQPFSCRCSQIVTDCRKEICCTCLFKESIPSIPCVNSKHPTFQKLEVSESRSSFRHLCIKWWNHAHPFVAAAERTCHMQRSRGSGHGVVVQRIVTI